jgi:hypothetical protein
MPHVRELSLTGNRIYLPDGMPEGIAQRSMRRINTGKMLRGRIAPLHLV